MNHDRMLVHAVGSILATIALVSSSVGFSASENAPTAAESMIVVGAGGTDEYLAEFREAALRWKAIMAETTKVSVLGPIDDTPIETAKEAVSDRQQLLDWIARKPASSSVERWLVLIGHGTYQSKDAKFNLEGADISSDELATAIDASPARWRIFVCASCSGPFLGALSGPDRIIVTATKSGSEQNYSRFGSFLSQSIGEATSDLDHDGSVSVLEAFIVASGRLTEWYSDENRIASEQSLLDDNGDQRGTPASFFRGVRAAKAPADGLLIDGRAANRVTFRELAGRPQWTDEQRIKITDIEQQIETLRLQKIELAEAIYFAQLELLLVDLAKLLVPPLTNKNTPSVP